MASSESSTMSPFCPSIGHEKAWTLRTLYWWESIPHEHVNEERESHHHFQYQLMQSPQFLFPRAGYDFSTVTSWNPEGHQNRKTDAQNWVLAFLVIKQVTLGCT